MARFEGTNMAKLTKLGFVTKTPRKRRYSLLFSDLTENRIPLCKAMQEARLHFFGPDNALIYERTQAPSGRPGLHLLGGVPASTSHPFFIGFRRWTLDLVATCYTVLLNSSHPPTFPDGKPVQLYDFWRSLTRTDQIKKWGDLKIVDVDKVLLGLFPWQNPVPQSELDDYRSYLNRGATGRRSRLQRRDWLYVADSEASDEWFYLGFALRRSRLRFHGSGEEASLRAIQSLSGFGGSDLSDYERGRSVPLYLDSLFSTWITLASGCCPPTHPLTGEPYSIYSLMRILRLNPGVSENWAKHGIPFRNLADFLDEEQKLMMKLMNQTSETTPPEDVNLRLSWLLRRMMAHFQVNLTGLASLTDQPEPVLRDILDGRVATLDLPLRVLMGIYSFSAPVRPSDRKAVGDWSRDEFLEWVSGCKIPKQEQVLDCEDAS